MTKQSLLILTIGLGLMIQLTFCSKQDALIDTGTGPTGLGKIQGANATTIRGLGKFGREYFWFSGLPFAKPESYTKGNRFKPSQLWDGALPNDTRDGIFFADVRKASIVCEQKPVFELAPDASAKSGEDTSRIFSSDPFALIKRYYSREGQEERKLDVAAQNIWGQEDCLTLTVSTPKIPKEGASVKLPVIFFIHGGGFDAFWGGIFGGQRLLNHDVVLVSINYRLGILGALNLGIEDAPGNGAVYDCITALRWVKKYIHHFGGDPDRVTVSGQSAGAVLATTVFLSPLSKGLIHGAIGASGSALSVWANQKNPIEEHLRIIGYTSCKHLLPGGGALPLPEQAQQLRNCMASLSAAELINTRDKYGTAEHLAGRMGYDAVVPSVQNTELGDKIELVLPASPAEILKRGQQSNVPLMMGATRHDGSFVMTSTFYEYLVANGLDSDATFIKNDLFHVFLKGVGIKDPSGALMHSMQKAYMGDAANSDDILSKAPGLLDLHTVIGFKAGAYGLVEAHSNLNPNSYYYAFDYQGTFTTFEIGFGISLVKGGIAHVDDLLYLFQMIPLATDKDFAVSDRYVKYWANFATYGNPNGAGEVDKPFPKFNPTDHRFLVINQTDSMGVHCRDTWQGNSLELDWIFFK